MSVPNSRLPCYLSGDAKDRSEFPVVHYVLTLDQA